jgi:hypothetical protein
MNNHANAQSVANAIEIKQSLGQPLPENLHPEMLKRYPTLRMTELVKAKQSVLTPVRKR